MPKAKAKTKVKAEPKPAENEVPPEAATLIEEEEPEQVISPDEGINDEPEDAVAAAAAAANAAVAALVAAEEDAGDSKRGREEDIEAPDSAVETKKAKTTENSGDTTEDALIPPSKEGTSIFNDADVLSGRGGGTNVHPGNRNFRDLINLHRRAYLKARKNDKPAISRAIVRTVRETNGRFLRKDDKSGLWFEIGDDAAREKTSQALRQRAPEMRKLLFDSEREEGRAAAEEHLRQCQQRLMMGMPTADGQPGVMPPGMPMPPMGFPNPAFFQAMAASNGGKPPGGSGQDNPYQQAIFQAAMTSDNVRTV